MFCFPFHDWGKWKTYEERGTLTYGPYLPAGGRATRPYVETRQVRGCKACGKIEDELVRGGPKPPEPYDD